MFFLGIDLGTSYFKSGIFNSEGKMIGFGRIAVPKKTGDLISELSYDDFINTLRLCVGEAIKTAAINRTSIVSVSYGSQANSFSAADKNGRWQMPFVLWNDNRAATDESIQAFALQSEFRNTTGIGIPFTGQFLLNKLKWWQINYPEFLSKESQIFTMPDYLCYILTGSRVTDSSTASLTGMLSYHTGQWWPDALAVTGIYKKQLSRVVPMATVSGIVNNKNNFLELSPGTIFCAGGLDHHIAAVGAGVGAVFDVSESTGTVIAAVEHSGNNNADVNVCIAFGLDEQHFFRMAFDENGAVALEWYQQHFAPEKSINDLIKMAELIPQGSEGLVALPCANRYKDLQGFENKTSSHTQGHFVRAIMESTAASLGNIFNQLEIRADAEVVSTGGGAKSILWRHIKSEMTHRNLFQSCQTEAACFGAAMIAAKGYGVFKNIYEAQANWLQIIKHKAPNNI